MKTKVLIFFIYLKLFSLSIFLGGSHAPLLIGAAATAHETETTVKNLTLLGT